MTNAGEVTKAVVSGFSGSPALLLIAVLNIAMIVGVGYVGKSQATERREMRERDDKIVQMLVSLCGQHPEVK